MKTLKYIIPFLMSLAVIISCDESSFLEEKPKDFYAPENSMITSAHFQNAVNGLYKNIRDDFFWNVNTELRFAYKYGTDFAFFTIEYHDPKRLNDYTTSMVPTASYPLNFWKAAYALIPNANLALNRLEKTNQVSQAEKNIFRGEILCLRSYAYKLLANLFGGVPLVLEEIETPRRDYVRATREEVYLQVKKDLEEAVRLLPDINDVKDGKLSKQVAQHILAEVCISLGLYDDAISHTTAVIDHPNMGLMTSRFGSRADEEGDVYWDLFRLNNQNRSSGNRESLWVLQYDYLNAGSKYSNNMAYALIPFYQNVMITAKDENGQDVKTTAFMGVTDWKGGRGTGWMQPTDYFFNDLWGNSFDKDIRNSGHNIVRDVLIDNPKSPALGKWFVKDGYSQQVSPLRDWFPIMTKVARVGNFPEDFYIKNSNGEPSLTPFGEHLLNNNANSSFMDEYLIRLAETYLLRAEAYLGKNDKVNAAKDINVVRARANATPADPAEVDIDYILDERLRELYCEEFRVFTLTRMGKLADRNRKYNPVTGKHIEDYHNLWPIPFSEIERNTGAVIEQNPGYK